MTNAMPITSDYRSLRVSVRSTFHESGKDKELDAAMEYIVQNVEDFHEGAASPRRGLFVTGPAGTGKTTSLKHAFAKVPEFQPRVGEYGELIRPLISLKLPKKCAGRDMVASVLTAMGLPAEGSEKDMTDFLMLQFKQRQVIVLHLDELQHTVRSNTRAAFEAVQDLLKIMMDISDWPLHLVLSGMPRIEKMRADDQIRRRSDVIPLHPMECPDDAEWIAKLMVDVAVKGCGLKLSADVQTDEFHDRLCRATNGAWGTLIELIQAASFRALSRSKSELTIKHFAQEYEKANGSARDENMFLAADYQNLLPNDSLSSMMEA
ncbi:AAA family ATPase [Rhizobium leguminosarum]